MRRPARKRGRCSTIDKEWPYSITGAPRVADGKVFIGNAGAEHGRARIRVGL